MLRVGVAVAVTRTGRRMDSPRCVVTFDALTRQRRVTVLDEPLALLMADMVTPSPVFGSLRAPVAHFGFLV